MISKKNRWPLEYLLIANLIIGILSLIKYAWNNIPNTVFDNRDNIPNTILGIFFSWNNIPNTETVLGILFLSLIPISVCPAVLG
jgi:hypothetical protein